MTNPKMEAAIMESLNPTAQDAMMDVMRGMLRGYHELIFWNNGMTPQTWEDPSVAHAVTMCAGGSDPMEFALSGGEEGVFNAAVERSPGERRASSKPH